MRFGIRAGFVAALLLAALAAPADAHPLSLEYKVTDQGGGTYKYDFTLSVDNNDGSYASGQGWRWFIFGDATSGNSSPLTGYSMGAGEFPVGPWTSLTSSGGGHNGPTFASVLTYWVPSGIGDSLSWSGTSTADLAQGKLLYSTIAGTLNNGVAANFAVADRIPEPATLVLLALGGAVALRRRRRKQAA